LEIIKTVDIEKDDKVKKKVIEPSEISEISEITESSDTLDDTNPKTTKPISQKQTEHIIEYLLKQENLIIKPTLNYLENTITYDVLKQVGLDETDSSYLDQLCLTSDLHKKHFQRLLVCPTHKNFSITLHNCCTKCNEQNILKKHLIEHVLCGNIEEYDIQSHNTPTTCSRCKKLITFTKDCKIHGMWYFCLSCKEKFDKPQKELYCREGQHSLKMEKTSFQDIFCYTHKHANTTSKIVMSIKNKIFSHYPSKNNVLIVGNSGIDHIIDMVCIINHKKYGIFLNYSDDEICEEEFHPTVLKILDIPDLIPIIITIPSVCETIHDFIKTHDIITIIGDDSDKVFEEFVKSTAA